MMRKICTFLLALCTCLLAACGGTGKVAGRVIALNVREGEGLAGFTVETEKGEQITLELSEDTHIFSFIEGLDENSFREGGAGRENSWRVILEYDKGLEEIMQDWAVPLKANEEGAA